MSNLHLLGLSKKVMPEVVFETTDRLHYICLGIYHSRAYQNGGSWCLTH